MARKSTRVYVPQIDKVFDSVSSAAKFLDLDSSNINKVLKGKRSQVGGFNFISADSTNGRKPNIAGLRSKADRFIENLSKRQMALQNKSLNTSGLASHPDFIDINPNFKARRDLRKNLKMLNNRIKDLRGKGLYNIAGEIIEEIEQQIKSWDGKYSDYYNVRSGDKLTSNDVEKRLKSVKVKLNNKTLNENYLSQTAKNLGKVFLSEQYVLNNSDIFPHVFRLLNKKFPDLDSDQIVQITNDLMELRAQNKITGEEIIQQLENIMEVYASRKFIYNAYGVAPEDLKKLDRDTLNNIIILEKIMNEGYSQDELNLYLGWLMDVIKKSGGLREEDNDALSEIVAIYINKHGLELKELEDKTSLSEEVLQTIEGWKY